MSIADSFECQSCGAPTDQGQVRCGYCGKQLRSGGPDAAREGRDSAGWISTQAGEFGFQGPAVLSLAGLLAGGLYGLGWYFEDTRYWLDTRAVTIWSMLLPAWVATVSFAFRARSSTWLAAFLLALVLWLIHSGMMAIVRGGLSDDHVGIGGLFAGASLAGWMLGRGLHLWVRYTKIQAWGRKA